MRDGVYRQNSDGTYSPAPPEPWREEHNRLQRLILWARGVQHCNEHEDERRLRWADRIARQGH